MRCEEAGLLISVGLDGELEANCAARLRAHLAVCAHCSAEHEALAGTVRLLRAIPEIEPPADLRRLIDRALLEVERRAQPRALGLAWLPRSRAPGWAWGMAAGAVAGAAFLMLSRGQPPSQRVAVLPNLSPSRVVTQSHSTRPPIEGRLIRRLPVAAPKRPAAHDGREESPPLLKVETPPTSAPSDLTVPEPPRDAQLPPPRSKRAHVIRRLVTHVHPSGSVAAPALPAPHPAPRAATIDPSGASADNSRPGASSSPDDPMPMPSDPDAAPDTSGMTKMALGGDASPAPEPAGDDLAELRRRLNDRPLQIPELGQQKPAESRRSNRDGWIRF